MKDVISFPKIGDYDIVFSYFLKKVTNIDVIPSPKITKKQLNLEKKIHLVKYVYHLNIL